MATSIHKYATNLNLSEFSTTQHWEVLKGISRFAGDYTIASPPRGRRKWMSENTWMLIEERNKLKCLMSGHCSETLSRDVRSHYRAKNKAVKRSVRCHKRKQIAELARDAEEAVNQQESHYSTTYEG